MSEDKKATIVTIAKELEKEVNAIDKSSTKVTIIAKLNKAEKKMTELMKVLCIKNKKSTKK